MIDFQKTYIAKYLKMQKKEKDWLQWYIQYRSKNTLT